MKVIIMLFFISQAFKFEPSKGEFFFEVSPEAMRQFFEAGGSQTMQLGDWQIKLDFNARMMYVKYNPQNFFDKPVFGTDAFSIPISPSKGVRLSIKREGKFYRIEASYIIGEEENGRLPENDEEENASYEYDEEEFLQLIIQHARFLMPYRKHRFDCSNRSNLLAWILRYRYGFDSYVAWNEDHAWVLVRLRTKPYWIAIECVRGDKPVLIYHDKKYYDPIDYHTPFPPDTWNPDWQFPKDWNKVFAIYLK